MEKIKKYRKGKKRERERGGRKWEKNWQKNKGKGGEKKEWVRGVRKGVRKVDDKGRGRVGKGAENGRGKAVGLRGGTAEKKSSG